MIKKYYTLTKPGIIYGNMLTVVVGFFLASSGTIDWWLLLQVILGLACIIASGCVFNNYIDRDIDALMQRTKNRVLVRGDMRPKHALVYGVLLGVVGISILAVYTNSVAVIVSIVGLFVYVVIYSMYLKRSSIHSALIGGISGAVPPVVGYVAVSGTLDMGAALLFIILVVWQMPHSFAIAIFRLNDYQAAKIPVLPVVKGIYITKVQMSIYTVLFVLATCLLFMFEYVGTLYLVTMVTVGVVWTLMTLQGLNGKNHDDALWAKKVFMFSIIVLLVWCIVIMVERLLV